MFYYYSDICLWHCVPVLCAETSIIRPSFHLKNNPIVIDQKTIAEATSVIPNHAYIGCNLLARNNLLTSEALSKESFCAKYDWSLRISTEHTKGPEHHLILGVKNCALMLYGADARKTKFLTYSKLCGQCNFSIY